MNKMAARAKNRKNNNKKKQKQKKKKKKKTQKNNNKKKNNFKRLLLLNQSMDCNTHFFFKIEEKIVKKSKSKPLIQPVSNVPQEILY